MNKRLVQRYYEDMWNQWDLGLVDTILAENIRFRGSLGVETRGREAFRKYMRHVQGAFPDFHNRIDEIVAEDDRVVARLTYTGTHRGEIFGLAGTGARISYAGAAFYRIENARIADGWVLGDVVGLLRQLGTRKLPA